MFKEKMSISQIIILIVFAAAAVIATILISMGGREGNAAQGVNYGKVNIWGTISQKEMTSFKNNLAKDEDIINSAIQYTYISEANFENRLLNAIADGTQPQMIVVSNKNIEKYKNRIAPIDQRYLSPSNLTNNFVEAAKVFVSDDKVMALPIAVDPMVMYYNKDMYSTNAITSPAKNWDEFKENVNKITIKKDKKITLSAAGIGAYNNVSYARELLLTLLLQTRIDFLNNIRFDENKQKNLSSVISFYTLFTNSSFGNKYYTWNSTFRKSMEVFTASQTATAFGFVSDNKKIRQRNPNLNYRMSEIPAISQSGNLYKATYANVYGLAFVKKAQNLNGSYLMLSRLKEDKSLDIIAKALGLPSAKNSIVSKTDGSLVTEVANKSAIYAKPTILKDNEKTGEIFKNLINNIITGRNDVNIGVRFAADEFSALDDRIKQNK